MKTRHLLIVLVVLAALGSGAGAAAQSDDPIPNGLIDVGGYSLFIDCQGEGSPTVILEAGLGQNGRTWLRVQRRIAEFTRVCSYDRAGIGGSDPSLLSPRPASVIAEELHTLLTNAHLEGPYVLVAHSYGGFYVRTFSSQYPDEVAGMVLIDTAHEDFDYPVPDDAQPDDLFLGNIEGVTVGEWRQTIDELHEARSAELVVPLIVLIAPFTRQPDQSDEDFAAQAKAWLNLQNDLATLSSNSLHVMVEDTSHFIQNDQPQIVIDAVQQVVEAVREDTPLSE